MKDHWRKWSKICAFIGDGDSSTFQTVSDAKPYGNDVLITKKECVGHVQKRLGTRLRKLKSSYTKRKLSGGKSIGGRGRLTDKMIDTMQNDYGLAIRQNKHNLQGMINDVKAGHHLAISISIILSSFRRKSSAQSVS